MKKSMLVFITTIFAISCLSFTSCQTDEELEKFSIKIINASDVDLNIKSVDVYTVSPSQWITISSGSWYSTSGANRTDSIENETSIQKKLTSETSSETITVDLKAYTINYIKLNCSYQTSAGTTAYPYIGILNGEDVTTYDSNITSVTGKYKTTDAMFAASGSPILNFVKTTAGDYVLCLVK